MEDLQISSVPSDIKHPEESKIDLTTIDGVNTLFEEILAISDEIPFGNSNWQNRSIINREVTPHRALRAAVLKIIDRLNALRKNYYQLRKKNIELKRLKDKLQKEEDPYDRELIEIEIEELETSIPHIQKLTKDAIEEINSLYPIVKSLGKITRDQFETLEVLHFERKFQMENATKSETLLIQQLSKIDAYDTIVKKGRAYLKAELEAARRAAPQLSKSVTLSKGQIEDSEKLEPFNLEGEYLLIEQFLESDVS